MDFIFDPSLVLYVPLSELDGASFASRDAYGHLCTVSGALWRPNGHYFDGSDDKMTLPHHNAFTFDDGITIITWAKRDATGARHSLVVKREGGASPNCFYLHVLDTDELEFSFVGVTAGAFVTSIKSATSIDTEWHFLAATHDNKNMVLYIENTIDKTQAETDTIDSTGTRDIRIGSFSTYWMEGLMGDIAIYSRALTPIEIQHNYLATKWRYR